MMGGSNSQNESGALNILASHFKIVSDSKGRINISLWFPKGRRSLYYVQRVLKSKSLTQMSAEICKQQNLNEHDLICRRKDGVYVVPELAVLAGARLNSKMLYDIYTRGTYP